MIHLSRSSVLRFFCSIRNFIFREIFDAIDVNHDGTVDFHEFLVVVVLMNRMNDLGQRLSFVFDM